MSVTTISTPDTIRVELGYRPRNSKPYVVDLRINSPESLSHFSIGKLDTAPAMVRLAKAKGLDAIAITDYYTANYVDRARTAGNSVGLTVLPGTMVRAQIPGCNEVKLCFLFPENTCGARISEFLQALSVPASAAYNSGYIVKPELKDVLAIATQYEALVYASRMDKTPYRKAAIRSLVEDYQVSAFDLAYYDESVKWFREMWNNRDFALFSFSNANILAQVGNRSTVVSLNKPGYEGLKQLISQIRS